MRLAGTGGWGVELAQPISANAKQQAAEAVLFIFLTLGRDGEAGACAEIISLSSLSKSVCFQELRGPKESAACGRF
jgi:hypothetical protein